MESNQITIIGGNIAGLSSAIHLTNRSTPIPCRIYEAKPTSWDKPCGGGFGIGWGDMLKSQYNLKIPLKLSKTLIFASKFGQIELPIPLYVTSRKILQQELFNYLSDRSSIEIVFNKRLNFRKHFEKFSAINIVATGINGFSRQALNKSFRDLGAFKYTLTENPEDIFIATIFYMIPEIKGYAWLFPAPYGKIDVGIGSLIKTSNLDQEFKKFINWIYLNYGVKLKVTFPLTTWGIPIPINKPGKIARKINKKIFVGVGDAIELADPATAAGIEPAWYSGQILGSAISSSNNIDVNKYYTNLKSFLIKNDYSSFSQHILASIARNPKVFYSIFPLVSNSIVKRIINS